MPNDDALVEVRADSYFAMIPEWVLDAGLSPSAIVVYLTLARYANRKSRSCYPSKVTIQEKSRLSHGTVSKALAELRDAGAITTMRRNVGGTPTSSLYVLHMAGPFGQPKSANEALIPKTAALIPESGSQTRQGNQTREGISITQDSKFDEFWSAYPRRVGKGQAKKAWQKAVKETAPEVIIEAARQFADLRQGQDQTYTPYPATWLHGERWLDQGETKATAPRRQIENDLVAAAMRRLMSQPKEIHE